MIPQHAQALAYARAGIPVLICIPNGKAPATPNGLKDRTTDEATINAWFAKGISYNIGVVPEDAGLCVIDVDPKNGGLDTWAALTRDKPPHRTRTIITPSGGYHFYFYGSLPSSAGRLGPGVDTRGRSSYVLVPPSVIGGVEYRDAP